MEFLTVQDAADILKVSKAVVYRWIKSGELTAVKIGGTVRISRRQLEKLYEGGEES